MGPVEVPADAYYGGQTMRAVQNFPISALRFPRAFIKALGQIKLAAAQVNVELGLLDPRLGAAIVQAAQEVVDGRHDSQFVVDIFQTGSGTSTNMNANEVIANRAIEILGGERGSKKPVHPNDHVNKGQSSNDVIPTAIHLAALVTMQNELVPALEKLEAALRRARAAERTYVVCIETDPNRTTEEGGWWWEVAVPEVSDRESVRKARAAYEDGKRQQKS